MRSVDRLLWEQRQSREFLERVPVSTVHVFDRTKAAVLTAAGIERLAYDALRPGLGRSLLLMEAERRKRRATWRLVILPLQLDVGARVEHVLHIGVFGTVVAVVPDDGTEPRNRPYLIEWDDGYKVRWKLGPLWRRQSDDTVRPQESWACPDCGCIESIESAFCWRCGAGPGWLA